MSYWRTVLYLCINMRNMHQDKHATDTTYRVAAMRIYARLVRLRLVLLRKNAVCGKIDDFEFLLVDLGGFVAGYGRPLIKGLGTAASGVGTLTRSWRGLLSRAGVMNVLCTRNLSLHLTVSGGSSFMGWSNTGRAYRRKWRICKRKEATLPCTSTLSPGSILPEFGRTQYCCWVDSCERLQSLVKAKFV